MKHHRANSAFHNVGYRLGRRKRMFQQRSNASDFSLAMAVLGIILMIIENELTSAQVFAKVGRTVFAIEAPYALIYNSTRLLMLHLVGSQ